MDTKSVSQSTQRSDAERCNSSGLPVVPNGKSDGGREMAAKLGDGDACSSVAGNTGDGTTRILRGIASWCDKL